MTGDWAVFFGSRRRLLKPCPCTNPARSNSLSPETPSSPPFQRSLPQIRELAPTKLAAPPEIVLCRDHPHPEEPESCDSPASAPLKTASESSTDPTYSESRPSRVQYETPPWAHRSHAPAAPAPAWRRIVDRAGRRW